MKESITIYTSSVCPVCTLVRDFFMMQEIPFEEVNIDLRPMERLKLITQSKHLRVPQTKINDVWISGFHPEKFFEQLSK